MARSKVRSRGNDNNQSDWKGFYNYDMGKAEKAVIRDKCLSAEQLTDLLVQLGERGYKVSVSWSDEHEFYSVSATGKSEGCVNRGYTITGRHSDLLVAATVVWFYCSERHEWGQWPVEGEDDNSYAW